MKNHNRSIQLFSFNTCQEKVKGIGMLEFLLGVMMFFATIIYAAIDKSHKARKIQAEVLLPLSVTLIVKGIILTMGSMIKESLDRSDKKIIQEEASPLLNDDNEKKRGFCAIL